MSDLPLLVRTFVRDDRGRFARRVGRAVDKAMKEAATYGRNQAVLAEPALADTFYVFREGSALYGYASAHPWAEGLDRGIPEHFIPANFDDPRWPQGFLANKNVSPRFFALGPGVKHPGVKPGLFMEKSFEKMMIKMPEILKKNEVRT